MAKGAVNVTPLCVFNQKIRMKEKYQFNLFITSDCNHIYLHLLIATTFAYICLVARN